MHALSDTSSVTPHFIPKRRRSIPMCLPAAASTTTTRPGGVVPCCCDCLSLTYIHVHIYLYIYIFICMCECIWILLVLLGRPICQTLFFLAQMPRAARPVRASVVGNGGGGGSRGGGGGGRTATTSPQKCGFVVFSAVILGREGS